ncbi:hypothetical protein FJTKL_15580 [Diaporthe vaccinii]|uniref:BZIP domain-containing protein n=1 Tax=Diaporthe vaccinii TaxID=105482 RepID=A0ABR4F721_9PEZI
MGPAGQSQRTRPSTVWEEVDDEERLCRRKRRKTKDQRQESRVIRSQAISDSIGRLGENNEVNGSAAPPLLLQTRLPRLARRDRTKRQHQDRLRRRPRYWIRLPTSTVAFLYPSVCLSLSAWPVPSNPFRHDFVFANAASAMVLRQPVTPLPIHQSQAFDKPSPGPPSGPVTVPTVAPVAVTVTVTATVSCMLLAGNCALPRIASPCPALHT